MHRILPVLIASLVLSAPGFAQRGGGHGGGGGGMRGGGGGGFHGGGGGFRGGGGGGFRGGGFRGGFRGGFGFRGRYGIIPFYGYYGGYGYYDPFFYDSYPYAYPDSYGYPYSGYGSSSPSVMIISNTPYAYPAAPAPEFAPPPESSAPALRQYPPAAQEPKYETPLFLIAFTDRSIRAVLAYWVDGTMLHYVSMEHEQKQAPLSSVDRDLSERLNRERNVTFRLPR